MKKEKPMKEMVNQAARTLAATRWGKKTPAERSAYASRIASQPRSEKRCFCGRHSMLRAAARRFDCCRKAGVITLNARPKKEEHDERRSGTGA
jgi:hypothetical protein